MALPRRPLRVEAIQMRVDKRTKRVVAADARRRGKSITELMLDAWEAYSPAAAALRRAS